MRKVLARAVFSFSIATSAVLGGVLVKEIWLKKYQKQKGEMASLKRQRDLLHTWLRLKQAGATFGPYFREKNCNNAAVLGMGMEGRLLLNELEREGVIVPVFGVEVGRFGAAHPCLPVYRWGEDLLPPADCLVVCGQEEEDKILPVVRKNFDGLVVTLDRVLEELVERSGIR